MVNIKGKGNLRTYFVCMNDKYEIQYTDPPEQDDDGSQHYQDKMFDNSTYL